MKAAAVIVTLCTASVAHAQPSFNRAVVENRYKESVDAEIQRQIDDAFSSARQTPVAAGQASASAQALEDGEPTSIVDKATAAIRTDLEDVEAGIQIAPLALAGGASANARAWTLMVAALEGSKFRVGTAYRRDLADGVIGLEDLPGCKSDWDARRKALHDIADDFAELCRIASDTSPPGAGAGLSPERIAWLSTVGACDLPAGVSEAEQPYVDAGANASASERLAIIDLFVSQVMSHLPAEHAPDIATAQVLAGTIAAVRTAAPSRASCHKDDVAEAVTRAKWDQKERVLGVAVTADFFPIIKGFDVDPDTGSPAGELAHTGLTLEYRQTARRFSWTIGAGGTMSRAGPDDDLAGAISGSARFDFVVGRLDGESIYDNEGHLALEDGKLPPLMSVGVDLSAALPLDPSDTQETQFADIAFDEVSITPFVDFRFSDELAFRIGAPIKAEAKTRESDEKRGLVWTVPVFVTTVLKL